MQRTVIRFVMVFGLLLTFSAYAQQASENEGKLTAEETREITEDLVKSRMIMRPELLTLVKFGSGENPCGGYFLPHVSAGFRTLGLRVRDRDGTTRSMPVLYSQIRVEIQEKETLPTIMFLPELGQISESPARETVIRLSKTEFLIRISKEDFEAANEVPGCLPEPKSSQP